MYTNRTNAVTVEAVHTHTHTHTHTSNFIEINKLENKPYLINIGFINNIKKYKDRLFLKFNKFIKNSLSFLCVCEVIKTNDKYA